MDHSSNNNHVANTKGGIKGHVIRRLLHVGMILVPFIYYYYGAFFTAYLKMSPQFLVIALLALTLFLEIIRLVTGLTVFGQRQHESKQVSSFTWAVISMALVLLFAPGREYAMPIIASCAIGDPVIGELRSAKVRTWLVVLAGLVVIGAIWYLSAYWYGITGWWAVVMAPLTVAAEWPQLKWIDDNALMQLIPLLLVCFIV